MIFDLGESRLWSCSRQGFTTIRYPKRASQVVSQRKSWKSAGGSCGQPSVSVQEKSADIVYDKIISLYQGRPVSFDEGRMHVPFRFLDQYEEQELWTPFAFPINRHYPGAPARAMSTFAAYSSLAVIIVSRLWPS